VCTWRFAPRRGLKVGLNPGPGQDGVNPGREGECRGTRGASRACGRTHRRAGKPRKFALDRDPPELVHFELRLRAVDGRVNQRRVECLRVRPAPV